MHFSSTLLLSLLPTLIIASDQVPLKEKAAGWFDKAKAYVSSATPDLPNPIDAGAAKVAALKVEKINLRNYQRKLGPKLEGEEEWMIYMTGGNKSCFGRCGKADLAWNESVPLLSALEPFSGSSLHLGTVNCEVEEVLCTSWAASVPSIWHFIFPQAIPASTSSNKLALNQPSSPLHELHLNISTITATEIAKIPRASKAEYLKVDEYVGAFHPIDGFLRKYSLLHPIGYLLWGMGSTPSWLFMIGLSFFSRQMMARRASQRTGGYGALASGAPPAGGAGAATGASPAARGAAKKRK